METIKQKNGNTVTKISLKDWEKMSLDERTKLPKKTNSAFEREWAFKILLKAFPEGSTAQTILRHCSRSGMSRSISVVSPDGECLDFFVSKLLGDKIDQKNGGIKVGGCGMDMGFNLIYRLSYALHDKNGYAIKQRWL